MRQIPAVSAADVVLAAWRRVGRTLASTSYVGVGPVVVRASVLFEPRDLWVGAYVDTDVDGVSLYLALVPTLPVLLVVRGAALHREQHGG